MIWAPSSFSQTRHGRILFRRLKQYSRTRFPSIALIGSQPRLYQAHLVMPFIRSKNFLLDNAARSFPLSFTIFLFLFFVLLLFGSTAHRGAIWMICCGLRLCIWFLLKYKLAWPFWFCGYELTVRRLFFIFWIFCLACVCNILFCSCFAFIQFAHAI